MRRSVVLFDLDMTLMVSDGAGRAAMSRAFEIETGRPEMLEEIAFHGRTDRWIAAEAARLTGLAPERLFERSRVDYPRLLREELARRSPYVLPGVTALLDALRGREETVWGLATGNLRETSFLKLASVGLDSYFDRGGGFGDDHEERAAMVRDAMAVLGWRPGDGLAVVGDTEHDVAAAHAVGAVAVGVATGTRSEADLARAGADVVLPDLGDLERALAAVLPPDR